MIKGLQSRRSVMRHMRFAGKMTYKAIGDAFGISPQRAHQVVMEYGPKHRRVATKRLGRPLRPGEVVHHINGITTDNRPKNLMVFSSNRAHLDYHLAERRLDAVFSRGGIRMREDEKEYLAETALRLYLDGGPVKEGK